MKTKQNKKLTFGPSLLLTEQLMNQFSLSVPFPLIPFFFVFVVVVCTLFIWLVSLLGYVLYNLLCVLVTIKVLIINALLHLRRKCSNEIPSQVFILIYFVLIQDQKSQAYLIGSIGVSGKTKWDVLDGVIRRLFKVSCTRYPDNDF